MHLSSRIVLATMMAVIASTGFTAYATQRSEKSVCVRAGYNTRNESPLAGIGFQYSFSSHFRLAPSVEYVFRNQGTDCLAMNVNAQFPVGVTSRFDFYPLVGLGFSSWNHQNKVRVNDGDVSTRDTRIGLNVGAGVEYYCTSALKLSLEGRFGWVKNYDSGVFSVGIGYVF